jgi:hypothetical protein
MCAKYDGSGQSSGRLLTLQSSPNLAEKEKMAAISAFPSVKLRIEASFDSMVLGLNNENEVMLAK